MITAYLFGGPADGIIVDLEEAATSLDLVMDENPYVTHKYSVYSVNNIGEEENQIYRYEGIKDDDERASD